LERTGNRNADGFRGIEGKAFSSIGPRKVKKKEKRKNKTLRVCFIERQKKACCGRS
jgi:hypothetical protein